MYPSGIVQVILSLGIVAVTVIAAWMEKWEIVGMCVTGAFALLRPTGAIQKEHKDETIINLVDPA